MVRLVTLRTWTRSHHQELLPLDLSEGLADMLERTWIDTIGGSITSVELPDELVDGDNTAWEDLGDGLVARLLQRGEFVGAYLDGDCPYGTVARWAESAVATGAAGIMNIRWHCEQHPMAGLRDYPVRNVQNVTWALIQEKASAAWLSSIWRDEPSTLYIGAELMLTVYGSAIGEDLDDTLALDQSALERFLDRAVAWVIPGDGWGYLVGLAPNLKPEQVLLDN